MALNVHDLSFTITGNIARRVLSLIDGKDPDPIQLRVWTAALWHAGIPEELIRFNHLKEETDGNQS